LPLLIHSFTHQKNTMDVALPTPPFNVGSNSTTTGAAAASSSSSGGGGGGGNETKSKSLMDMSLDDLIKARRTENKKSSSSDTKRTAIKTKSPNPKANKPTPAQRSIGTNKAKRNANTKSNRGLNTNNNGGKASKSEISFEIDRQKRSSGGSNNNNDSNTTNTKNRRDARRRRNPADTKAKAKNVAAKKGGVTPKGKKSKAPKAPPKRAVNAAVKAMTGAGFKPPEGMKMVISFAPTDANGNNNNNNTQGGGGNNNNSNNNNSGANQNKGNGNTRPRRRNR
jgi:hypothetical protein